MDSGPNAYILIGDETPQEIFEKTINFIDEVQNKLNERGTNYGMGVISKSLTSYLATVIFGSNCIERAGLGLEETINICEQIFRGECVDSENIADRSVSPPIFLFLTYLVFIFLV